MIATPMYGGLCTSNYTDSLINNICDLAQNKIHFSWGFLSNESLIQRARNHLVNGFLQTSATHLMFIDADIEFPRNSIRKLLDAEKEVIVGLYPFKNFSKRLVVNGLDGNKCVHAGTGFMLISRQVFEKLSYLPKVKDSDNDEHTYTLYFNCETDSTGVYLSEDWWFCNKCTENGIDINVDLSIELKHVGTHTYISPLSESNNGN